MGEGKVRPCSPSNTSGGERGVGGLRCFAGEVTPLADVMVLFPPFRLRSGSPNARQSSYNPRFFFGPLDAAWVFLADFIYAGIFQIYPKCVTIRIIAFPSKFLLERPD